MAADSPSPPPLARALPGLVVKAAQVRSAVLRRAGRGVPGRRAMGRAPHLLGSLDRAGGARPGHGGGLGRYRVFCPMDPGVLSDWPGKCSICYMALVRREKGDRGHALRAWSPASRSRPPRPARRHPYRAGQVSAAGERGPYGRRGEVRGGAYSGPRRLSAEEASSLVAGSSAEVLPTLPTGLDRTRTGEYRRGDLPLSSSRSLRPRSAALRRWRWARALADREPFARCPTASRRRSRRAPTCPRLP